MDDTERKMTKIAREVSKFTVQTMKEDGIGTAEFDFIHLVRHNSGITQAKVRETLKIDRGAAAKRVASLETKGYLIRLLSELSQEEKAAFCQTLDTLYWKCKLQRRAGFVDVTDYLAQKIPLKKEKKQTMKQILNWYTILISQNALLPSVKKKLTDL